MRADIIPVLAQVTGMSYMDVTAAYAEARNAALEMNKGRDDTRTFYLTVSQFRAKHPFPISALRPTLDPNDEPTAPVTL